jgi:hypothetical protein
MVKSYLSLFIIFFVVSTTSFSQTKLLIVKGLKVQLEFKQGQMISLNTKDGLLKQGIIYLVTEDSLYLNNYITNIDLKEIATILPAFKPNFDTYKPSGKVEWLTGIYMSVMALFTFDYHNLRQMWLPNTFDNPNLTKKQQRMRKKTFNIGGKYQLEVK